MLVTNFEQRRDAGRGKLSRFFKNSVNQIVRQVAKTALRNGLVQSGNFLQSVGDFLDRRAVHGS